MVLVSGEFCGRFPDDLIGGDEWDEACKAIRWKIMISGEFTQVGWLIAGPGLGSLGVLSMLSFVQFYGSPFDHGFSEDHPHLFPTTLLHLDGIHFSL